MILIAAISCVGVALGFACVRRFGWTGFGLAAVFTFLVHFAVNFLGGYEGLAWEESLSLFNGSILSFAGYSAQITYRAFAMPALAIGLGAVYGMKGRRDV